MGFYIINKKESVKRGKGGILNTGGGPSENVTLVEVSGLVYDKTCCFDVFKV